MKTNYKKNPKKILGYLMAFAMVFFSTSSVIAEDLDITVGGGSWTSEVSWDITDASGAIMASGVVGSPAWSGTIPSGCYDMNMYDSYGDGWNGSTYSIVDQTSGQIYATGGLTSGSYGVDNVCWGGATAGCTDSTATNYDPLASVDDGSCTYPCLDNEITLNMIDSYGDGWNGNTFVLTNSAGTVVMNSTLASGSSGSEVACLPDDCYIISWVNGSFMSEVSWDITDASGAVLASGGAPGSGLLDLGGLCALGCTDPGASNYDSLANVDDGSCTYANCSNVTLNMVDSYGDGWNGNVFEMSNSAGIVVMSSTLASGSAGVDSACIADDCYTITCGGGSYISEVSWTLVDDATGNVLASGGSPYTGATICLPAVFGCMDMFADNYDSLATINSGCLYTGCMDPMATNYCSSCNVSDSASCIFPVANYLDFCDNFEANNLSGNGWLTSTGSAVGQFIGLTTANAIADTVSLESTGSDSYTGWTQYSTEALAFANVTHVNSATILFDMSAQSGIVNLGLDYVTQSGFTNTAVGLVGTAYSTMRVKVNGNVITDINGISWHGSDGSLVFDLSSNAGNSAVYVTIETACKYNANYSSGAYGDFVWVDNVCAYEVTPCTNYGIAADYAFDASCNGGSDGMASATAFGDAAFSFSNSYDWTDASGVSVGTGSAVSGLSAGTYTCTSTDATNGCSASTSVTIGEPSAISASAVVIDATSPINTDGSVSLSASGGSPCFTGANDTLGVWDGGTEYVWSGVAAGMTHYFDITATNGSGITGFDIKGVYAVAGNIEIWTRSGTANGNTTSSAGWTLNTSIPNPATVNGVTVYVPLMSAVGMEAGDVTGFAIHTPSDAYLTLGGLDAFSSSLASDANISVSTGVLDANGPTFGGSSTYGGIGGSANFDGAVYYTSPAYTYAWSNGATTQNVSGLGMGPISVTVTDCNGCTGVWSGFVAANIVNGCTDVNASNFDPAANTDDGSCLYPGCTDSLANNFDPSANLNDSSCTYSCMYNGYDDELTIECFIDLYTTEQSWELIADNGDTIAADDGTNMTTSAIYTTVACADNGCYTLYFHDSYGDGWLDWNGTQGWISVTDNAGNVLSMDSVYGDGGSATISVGGAVCIPGCTDSLALNYDPAATSDDGSCVICNDNFMTLNMYDSFGDGWNGSMFSMTDASGAMFVNTTLAAGSFASEAICLVDGCWDIDVTTNPWPTEVSWELVDINGTIVMSGGAPYTGVVCLPAVPGCMDSTACNYDPLANTDNGSCDFSCYGCTDPLALNYDASMTVDDGSCYYCALTASTSVVDESGVGANDGSVDLTVNGTYCVTNTDLFVSVAGGNGQSGNAFNVINTSGADIYIDGFKQGPGSGNTSVIGASMEVFCAYGDYLSAPVWTSVATATVDLTASATTGYCQIPGGVTIPAGGTYGFWVGLTSGTVQYTNGTGTPGVTAWASDANITVTEGHGGTYPTGLNFSPRNWNGTVVYGDPNASTYSYVWSTGDTTEDLSNATAGTYTVDVTDCMGCMVSASATIAVNMVPGCTDPTAFNYNPLANFDDGSCVPVVDGCTDTAAANYDATANTDDGSCHYCFGGYSVTIECGGGSYMGEVSWDLLDASGAIILSGGAPFSLDTCIDGGCYSLDMYDSYGDGWNGNVFSITDNTSGASVSAGLASGSIGSASLSSAALGCFTYGCTDPLATNYDATANTDDGSCTYPACVTSLPFDEDFETGMADVTLLADVGNFGSASSIDSLNNGTWSWHGQGGSYTTWLSPYSTGPDAFATNPTHIATMAMCVDLTAYAGQPITVSFDLRQEFSFNGTYSYFRLADDMGAVLADGNGNDYFSPATACGDAWENVSYDLSAYAGGVVNLMFQSCNKYNDDYYQCGDNAYVDNINISVQATPVLGCTDPAAVNFDPAANTDDGSCCYGNWATLEMMDSYGDGWNGNYFIMTDVMTGAVVFNSTCVGSATVDNGCVPDGCYDITVNGGSWQSEVSWNLVAAGDTTSGGAPYAGQIAVGSGSCAIGCTDPLAVNYDASALVDDGSCMYPCLDNSVYIAVVTDYYGDECSWDITDASGAVVASGGPYSIGYNTVSDSACVIDGCYTLNMYDGYGDGWSTGQLGSVTLTDGMGGTYAAGQLLTGTSASFDFTVGTTYGCTDTSATNYDACANTDDGSCVYPCALNDVTIVVGGGSWMSEVGWSLVDGSGTVVASGGAPYSGTACLADDCYTMNMTDAYGDGWNGNTYSIDDNNSGTNYGTGGLTSGAAGSDQVSIGASCAVLGCTDPLATNYDSLATQDDGSCTYSCASQGLDDITINLYDSWGDGWNGNTLTVDGVDYTIAGYFSSESFSVCADLSTCISALYNNTGSYASENSWDITDASGAVLISGGNVGSGGDFGNCGVAGCMDSTACNYDPLATFDPANSCDYSCYGCTDANASNYDANATIDDGSCTYSCAYLGLDEITVNLYDSYGDGWNGNTLTVDGVDYTIAGWASSESFTVCADLSTCISALYNATGSWQSENSWDITDASGAVLISGGNIGSGGDFGNCGTPGCMDSTACNYDASATIDDGSCDLPNGCGDPTAFNYDSTVTCSDPASCIAIVYGCIDPSALNYYAGANSDDGSCVYVAGCTDATACNYDPLADFDDGSCEWTSCGTTCANSAITGLFISDIIDDQVLANFDNMNTYDANGTQICRVDQIRIKYREVGTSAWSQKNIASPTGYDPITGVCNSTQKTDKPIRNLTPATEYEWQVKVWYCNGGTGAWTTGSNFTTAGECPNVGNLTAYGANPTKATFDWDDSNGSYEFARIKMRVDSISNPQGSDWFLVGGSGVTYGTFTKNKNGLVAGETYRAQARTWCDPNGGAYNSLSWTSLVTWTQPTSIRVEGGSSIANLDVYPNPSRDVFNVTFTSEDVQDLEVRVINVVGEVVYTENLQQFVGEYIKSLDLESYTKGVYFLEITTNNGVVNKKLILQ